MKTIQDFYDEVVLPMFNERGIEDTTENRFLALTETQRAWKEVESDNLEIFVYQAALQSEIFALTLRLKFPKLMEDLDNFKTPQGS